MMALVPQLVGGFSFDEKAVFPLKLMIFLSSGGFLSHLKLTG